MNWFRFKNKKSQKESQTIKMLNLEDELFNAQNEIKMLRLILERIEKENKERSLIETPTFSTEKIEKSILKAIEINKKEKDQETEYFLNVVEKYLIGKSHVKNWIISDKREFIFMPTYNPKFINNCELDRTKYSSIVIARTNLNKGTRVTWYLQNQNMEWRAGDITIPDYELLKGSNIRRDKIWKAIEIMLENKEKEILENKEEKKIKNQSPNPNYYPSKEQIKSAQEMMERWERWEMQSDY